MSRQAILVLLNWANTATKESQEKMANALTILLKINSEVLADDVEKIAKELES